ncbi:Allantoinase [bioreactor metagenome]|uniref:Allantoinase n=1 Tax=bioreactor metagenome TaxID=1076179 RepID=A0A644U7X3_9ZZZZ|nr:dihydroorotase family protein [Negativicutes bacterium]
MSYHYDILLKNGLVVDPVTNREEIADIAIAGGKIVEIMPGLSAEKAQEAFDLKGHMVMPGIVDLHAHASAWLGGRFGHKMMAQVGVTTALDMSGPIDSVLDIASEYGVGMNIACIQYVRPGHTVRDTNPGEKELETLLEQCLTQGGLGFKMLGGHYPLTPEATARAIEIVNKNKAYVAFHAGSLNKGSNIEGFLEAVELAQGNSLHMAHINSYCRGSVRPCLVETEEAIAALEKNPNIRSEAYLSPMNGTSAKCSGGTPESLVTHKCLNTGGFEATEAGLEAAILAGWAQINLEKGGEVVLAIGQEALEYWRSKGTETTVSFSVNPPEPRLRLAVAKRQSGEFVVDCIGTDGGGIPRNVIAEMGLSLVRLQALTLKEFVQKISCTPARILGLKNKGHFTLGADADITVLDLERQRAYMSLVNGKVIMYKGYVCGKGGNVIATAQGEAAVRAKGLNPVIVDLADSKFYQR